MQGAGWRQRPGEAGAVPGPILDGGTVEVDRAHRKVRRVLPGGNRIAEGQRRAARTAGVGRGTAVVERQRRRATGHRHRLAHRKGQRNDMAGVEIAIATGDPSPRCDHRRDRRGDGGGGGRYSARECVTSGILDVGAVVVDPAHRQTSGGVPGGRRIAEGQRIGAGAARVHSRPAAGERERRGSARNGDGFAHGERQRDDAALGEIAVADSGA